MARLSLTTSLSLSLSLHYELLVKGSLPTFGACRSEKTSDCCNQSFPSRPGSLSTFLSLSLYCALLVMGSLSTLHVWLYAVYLSLHSSNNFYTLLILICKIKIILHNYVSFKLHLMYILICKIKIILIAAVLICI